MEERIEKLIEEFSGEVSALSGEALVSLALYGSAVTGEYLPGRSDLNFLIVLTRAEADELELLVKPLKKYRRQGVGVPIVLDEEDLRRSLDAFPMEFLNMKSSHRLIRGQDLLPGLEIPREPLRLQCEREIRGKLIQLRRAYLETGEKPRLQELLFRESIKAFIVIMRSMLWLDGMDPLPIQGGQVIEAMASRTGIKLEYCRQVYSLRQARVRAAAARRIFGGYLAEINLLAEWIDRWAGKGEKGS